MASVHQFITPAGADAYRLEKKLDEQRKAVAFLQGPFARETAGLDAAALAEIARLGLSHAGQRGITALRDRQRYLIPAMFWGSFFEQDPQYHRALSRCWWFDAQGLPTGSTHISAVIAEIDRMQARIAPDLSDPRRPVETLALLYRRHSGETVTRAILIDTMAKCWPARFALMEGPVLDAYLVAAEEPVRRFQLRSVDAVAYVCLSMHLGVRFVDDPRFPWARRALEPDGRPDEERRLAFGQAVLAYWRATTSQVA